MQNWALANIVRPVLVPALVSLVLPPAATFGLLPLLSVDAHTQTFAFKYIYLLCVAAIAG